MSLKSLRYTSTVWWYGPMVPFAAQPPRHNVLWIARPSHHSPRDLRYVIQGLGQFGTSGA
jgi:hypothetical protein